MKTLIAYATKYGATKECAQRIGKKLPGEVDLHELTKGENVDLTPYDTVIIGSSVYIGKPRKEAKDFCKRHLDVLLQKRTGLFLCCIQDSDKAVAEQFSVAYPAPLREHASALGALGGIVNHQHLSKIDAFIMKLVAGDLLKKTGHGVISTLSEENIERFAQLMAEDAEGT